jgi:hypothetical protein
VWAYAGTVSEVITAPKITTGRKIRLGLGGLLAGLVLLLELYLGALFTAAWFWPWPPAWLGLIISLLVGLAGPVATYLVWRSGRRKGGPRAATLGSMEVVGGNVGLLAVVVLVAMLFVAAPF